MQGLYVQYAVLMTCLVLIGCACYMFSKLPSTTTGLLAAQRLRRGRLTAAFILAVGLLGLWVIASWGVVGSMIADVANTQVTLFTLFVLVVAIITAARVARVVSNHRIRVRKAMIVATTSAHQRRTPLRSDVDGYITPPRSGA